MKYGVSCKLGLALGAALLLLGGCAGPESTDEGMGTARVRIEAARTDNFEITQVIVAAQGGFQTELIRDSDGGFVGTLLLPAGFNELTGQAFAGAKLVGVSQPVPVQIQAGFVTAANIRILDITGGQDIGHSPIVLSLTHPLSAVSNQPVQLGASVLDPDGDPVSATWSSDCADAEISPANDFFTNFVKLTPGTCRVTIVVSDGALTAIEAFTIVVFDQNQVAGAVNVDGEFVSAPQLFLDINLPGPGICSLFLDSQDGTCQGSIASPERAFTSAFVDWGTAQPGFVDIIDNCGGLFEVQFNDPFFFQANWRPPTTDTVCLVTARAFSNDGVFSQLTAAVRVLAGQPDSAPQIFASLSHTNGFCEAAPGQTDVFCPAPVFAGSAAQFFANVDWANQPPGGITISSSCGQIVDVFGDQFFLQGTFLAPPFDTPCLINVTAIAQNGTAVSTVTMRFDVVGAPPAQIEASVSLESILGACNLSPGQTGVDCPPVQAGGSAFLRAQINWGSAPPGFIQVGDTCGGGFSVLFSDPFVLEANWFPPFIATQCIVQVTAFAANGQVRAFEMIVPTI